MARKVVIIADPGIDAAFAVSLALLDPDLDLVGVGASAGNVASPGTGRASASARSGHIVAGNSRPIT